MSKNSGFLKDNFFGSVSAKTSAVVLAGLMSLAPVGGKLGTIFGGTAHAQDSAEAATLPPDFNKTPVSIPQPSTPKREAWMDASDYAVAHPAVAVALYGRTHDATQQQIANFYRQKFNEQDVPVEFYFADEERIGAKVAFFLKDVSYGPTTVAGSFENFAQAVSHFPQAWPNHHARMETPSRQPGS